MIIAAPRLYLDGRFTGPGAVAVDGDRISAINPGAAPDQVLASGFLTPGLIDLHNNGAFGVDFATAEPSAIRLCLAKLASRGVTTVLPTIITAPLAALRDAAQRIAAAGAIGLHLEGPFLARARRGAHRSEWLLCPDDKAVETALSLPGLALVTLAPELPGALAAIARLAGAKIRVALGHSDADAATATRAIEAGASLATHVFNASSPLSHRAPGLPGIALTDARLAPCLITDGVHVDPVVLRLAFAAAGSRAIAVTDSVLLAGLAEGARGSFGGAGAILAHGAAYREDGTLAGAAITLDEGLRRLIGSGIPAEAALFAATAAPAAAMGWQDRGVLARGTRADLVWWDDDFHPRAVWIGGERVDAAVALRASRPPAIQTSESARGDLADLDERPLLAVVETLLAKEAATQAALRRAAPNLALLADLVAEKLASGGRLFYAGAGTSGRLAVLDAVECGPTFGVPEGMIVPLLAGGSAAITQAAEGAEDDEEAAIAALAAHGIGPADVLVGIAASGRTPFTTAAIRAARALNAATGAIVNAAGPVGDAAGIAVLIETGAEIIAGSTRLSAGTAQKIALNTLSTAVMVRLGKTYGPLMVDLRVTNAKLRARAIAMVARIAHAEPSAAETALAATAWRVKPAVLMIAGGLDAEAAAVLLTSSGGRLRPALQRVGFGGSTA